MLRVTFISCSTFVSIFGGRINAVLNFKVVVVTQFASHIISCTPMTTAAALGHDVKTDAMHRGTHTALVLYVLTFWWVAYEGSHGV